MFGIGAKNFHFLERHRRCQKTIVRLRLAARADQSENLGVFARHDSHAERARDADARLLNQAVRHNRQELPGFRAEKLYESDKHPFPGERKLFQPGGTVELLLLDDIGGHAQS